MNCINDGDYYIVHDSKLKLWTVYKHISNGLPPINCGIFRIGRKTIIRINELEKKDKKIKKIN